ncbi:MAG: hypothetical protein RR428_00695 [Coprobacillus sp.]
MKNNKVLGVLLALMSGIVLGFLLAPIKKGVNVEVKNIGHGTCDKEA